MIQRRGFLAGCLAVLASPLAWFWSKRNHPKYDLTLSQIDEFMEMASRERSSQMCRQSKEIDKIIAEIDRLDRESKEALIKASEDYLFGVGGRHGVSGGLISRRKLGSISRPTT